MPRKRIKKRTGYRKNWRQVIGLTGGISSGKSTVLQIFKTFGAFILDADHIVHQLLKTDKRVQNKIRKAFGSGVFTAAGSLNRKKLAPLVFSSSVKRKKLESLLHPLVWQEMKQTLLRKKGEAVVCDIPLLMEKGWAPRFDSLVVVSASDALREKRAGKKGLSRTDFKQRVKAQMPLAEKRKKADFVIHNYGTRSHTKSQSQKIWKKINN